MAREISFTKRAKITQAQQYMLLSVLGASVALGAALSLTGYFINQISFNAEVVSQQDASIVKYSNAIKDIGVCPKPKGSTYSEEELEKCNPDTVSVSEVQGSLRSNILEHMSENVNLSSVPKENNSDCTNADTGKPYTYKELQEIYDKADDADEMIAATNLIQGCSALRIIPDALPAYKNEEALLASLNKIFILSDWTPESLSPTGESMPATFGSGLNELSVRLTIEADSIKTLTVLDGIERSIRDFNISRASFEWQGTNSISLQAQATAYYMEPAILVESTNKITPGGK